jgi:predicted DNA-binding helix-hairpin-helix protein
MVTIEKMAHLASGSCFDAIDKNPDRLQDSTYSNQKKVSALGAGTKYDICTSSGCAEVRGVCHSFTHDGRCISLFKTLYTNQCSHQCNYCSNSANCSQKAKIFSYTPKELAKLTISLYRSNYIEGLFLSSGSGKDADTTMEKLIETARILRDNYRFSGYIHLKILPGASLSHILEAMELSTRVSVNLEAPSASHMSDLSSTKDYNNDIIKSQRYVKDLIKEVGLPAGQTTQLVIGAGDECDREIFSRIIYEYKELEVKRAYYSAFSPQKGTVFSKKNPQPLYRERRLYQMDWLYRVYHFDPKEIELAFDGSGNLPNLDPKTAIARQLIDRPVDPNIANYKELVRVPGIGPCSARRIMLARKRNIITKKEDLSNFGVRIKSAIPFLKINGWSETTLDRWFS